MSSEEIPLDAPDDIAQETRQEEHLLRSMAKLQDMHIRLRQLRDTTPSLIRPFRGIESSPEAIYAEFVKIATGAVNNTKDFVTMMKSRDSQTVLLEARKSRSENSNDITGWLAEQHEDWFDRLPTLDAHRDPGHDLDDDQSTWTSPPLEEAVQDFEKSHPDAKIMILGGGEIQYTLPSPAGLVFHIQETKSPSSSTAYLVTCDKLGQSGMQGALCQGINQALSQRPRQFDLGYTLLLLSTYSDIMSRSCSKCNRLFDPSSLFPVVRQRNVNDDATIQSRALHTGCT